MLGRRTRAPAERRPRNRGKAGLGSPIEEARAPWNAPPQPGAQRSDGPEVLVRPCDVPGFYARAMRINDEDFPTLAEFAERLELRELERLARMMMVLLPDDTQPLAVVGNAERAHSRVPVE
jgi:hypothetical protein